VVLESDGGELLLVGDGDGVAHVVRRRTVNPGMAPRCSIASSRGGESRLERLWRQWSSGDEQIDVFAAQ
jgi:hypothetical protein